jgi:hypothetical protein
MDPLEAHGKGKFWDLENVQKLISENVRKLARFKEKVAKNEINVRNFNLYNELFKGFIECFVEFKRAEIRVDQAVADLAIDKIVELPIFRWKSKLKSIPGISKMF